jgi:hypothetical protein
MSVDHLHDKRTGRPPGSKSTPRWVRDVRWAYRHLGKPDAVPPSALAGFLVALAREHPDRFITCLALADAQSPKAERKRRTDGVPSAGSPDGCPDGQSRRLKRLTVWEAGLFEYLRGGTGAWVYDLPADAHVVACEADTSHRALRLTIRSVTFPEVAEGEPLPGVESERANYR